MEAEKGLGRCVRTRSLSVEGIRGRVHTGVGKKRLERGPSGLSTWLCSWKRVGVSFSRGEACIFSAGAWDCPLGCAGGERTAAAPKTAMNPL
jgi:hypothetical protein